MTISSIGASSTDYLSLATRWVGEVASGPADATRAKPARGGPGQAGQAKGESGGVGQADSVQLSPEVQREVQRLKQIDQKVRAHEQAHLSAAAGLATGGASYQTVRGPDGRQYAVAGEVQISVSAAATPEQTITKAQRIRAAALAPSDPSSQDRAVAAGASQLEQQARIELSRQKNEETDSTNPVTQLIDEAASRQQGRKAIEAYRQTEPAPQSTISSYA